MQEETRKKMGVGDRPRHAHYRHWVWPFQHLVSPKSYSPYVLLLRIVAERHGEFCDVHFYCFPR